MQANTAHSPALLNENSPLESVSAILKDSKKSSKIIPINEEWLSEFSCIFDQLITGDDGDAVGRSMWFDMGEEWREARRTGSAHACSDAEKEAEAWNIE